MEGSFDGGGVPIQEKGSASASIVERVFDKGEPFVYLHTHVVTPDVLDTAKAAGKSLEVDVAVGDDGMPYVGHPLVMYESRGLPPPNNLPLDTVVDEMKQAGLFLVLDCKDVRALPKVQELIKGYGTGNNMLHSWAQELVFKPFPPEIVTEPQWPIEELPIDDLVDLKRATDVPVIISARGLTQDRLTSEEGEAIIQKILNIAEGKVDAVNFSLPNNEAPPLAVMQRLLDHHILTWINVDTVPPEARPPLFIGASDNLDSVSNPQEFAA